jgi:sulfite exporter TauE/SafE
VLSWSNAKYKLTLGVGCLAIGGMLAELWQHLLPLWVALVIVLLPVVVFVFVHPGELPTRLVRLAHAAASIWYVVVATGLLIALATRAKPLPRGWPVYPLGVAIGAVPCGIVLCRVARGRYPPPVESEGSSAEPDAAPDRGGQERA